MRAFYHPDQSKHDPQQYMRFGKIVAPKDLPERTERLLGALSRLWVRLQPTDDAGAGVAAAVEAGAFGVPPPRAKANADPWLD